MECGVHVLNFLLLQAAHVAYFTRISSVQFYSYAAGKVYFRKEYPLVTSKRPRHSLYPILGCSCQMTRAVTDAIEGQECLETLRPLGSQEK